MPLRIIPDRSEAPEDDVQSSTAKGRDVFDDRERRPGFGDDPEHFEPQSGSRTAEPGADAGKTDILTRESAANDVRQRDTRAQQPGESDVSNITENRNVGPMATEYPPGVWVDFAKRRCAESAGGLKAK